MGRAVHPHFITPDSADGGDIITGSTRFRKEDTFQFLELQVQKIINIVIQFLLGLRKQV